MSNSRIFLQSRIDDYEEELETERNNRSKVEKQRAELSHEMDDLAERLDEAGGATAAQIDVSGEGCREGGRKGENERGEEVRRSREGRGGIGKGRREKELSNGIDDLEKVSYLDQCK